MRKGGKGRDGKGMEEMKRKGKKEDEKRRRNKKGERVGSLKRRKEEDRR